MNENQQSASMTPGSSEPLPPEDPQDGLLLGHISGADVAALPDKNRRELLSRIATERTRGAYRGIKLVVSDKGGRIAVALDPDSSAFEQVFEPLVDSVKGVAKNYGCTFQPSDTSLVHVEHTLGGLRREVIQLETKNKEAEVRIRNLARLLEESDEKIAQLSSPAEGPLTVFRMNELLFDGYVHADVEKAKTYIEETDAQLSHFRETYGLAPEALFAQLRTGTAPENLPAYATIKSRHDRAVNVKEIGEEFVNIEKADQAISDLKRLEKLAGELSALTMMEERTITYLMEAGEDNGNYVINVYLPLRYHEQLDNLSPTETNINSLVLDSWVDLRDEEKGEGGKISHIDTRGILTYRFTLPKIRIGSGFAEIRDKFAQQVVGNQHKNPLYSLGYRFAVSELRHTSEHHLPPLPHEDVSVPHHVVQPQEPSSQPPSGEYALFSSYLNQRGVKTTGDPAEYCAGFDAANPKDRVRALTSAAILAVIGDGEMKRGEICRAIRQLNITYDLRLPPVVQGKTNCVDNSMQRLMTLQNPEDPNSAMLYRAGTAGSYTFRVNPQFLSGGGIHG